jgi:hypothetical protein
MEVTEDKFLLGLAVFRERACSLRCSTSFTFELVSVQHWHQVLWFVSLGAGVTFLIVLLGSDSSAYMDLMDDWKETGRWGEWNAE